MATTTASRKAAKPTKVEEEREIIDVEAVSSEDEQQTTEQEQTARHIGRKERAARKEIAKAATLKPIPHIKRVTFKRTSGPVFAISNAEVYLDTTSGHYVVYGQPMVETNGMGIPPSGSSRLPTDLAASSEGSKLSIRDDDEDEEGDDKGKELENAEEEADASGLDEKDIAIVMDQANVGRAKAIKALKANSNDIVNTIMELTM